MRRPAAFAALAGMLVVFAGLLAGSAAYAQATCPSGCDDANPCTDDLCDAQLGCVHYNNSQTCSDGNTCTTGDVCGYGLCIGGGPASGCAPCSAAAAIPDNGGTFVGTTSGTGTLAGTCGSSLAAPERVYRWTPRTSGVATISTCGTGTNYDSVVYLRNGSCTGTQVSCNDDGPCATSSTSDQGSRITPTVTAGQTYFIVVDGYNGARGTYTLTVDPPRTCGNGIREGSEACDGADSSQCATNQCTSQCTCSQPSSGLPDLVPDIIDVSYVPNTSVPQGDVTEGCAESTSGIDLLRFGVRVRNDGDADLYLGNPGCPNCLTNPLAICANANFLCSPAAGHNHPHYSNYARYELIDPTSQAVVIGQKQGFCLQDSVCSTGTDTYNSCNDQGISAGCADVYGAQLGCQYLDVTGIAAGNYTLRVTVDPFSRIGEENETNNIATVPVTIGNPPGGGGACQAPAVVPATGGVVTGTTSGTSSLSGTCANTGSSPEKVFEWTPANTGTATIETCSTATNFDTVMYLRGANCASGSQVGCNDDTTGCATSSGANHGSRIAPAVTAGTKYFIVVDGYNGASGNFSLRVTPPGVTPPPPPPPTSACSTPTSVPAAGGVFTGTTSGTSTLAGTCGNTGSSPEKVFQWTPDRSGVATIQTCGASGTSFDTVLYLRGAQCTTGSQVGCNDDTSACATSSGASHGSRLRPTVTAGQTYFIVVDGYQGAQGNFALTITPPP